MIEDLENFAKTVNENIEFVLPKKLSSEWLNYSLGNPRWSHDEEACTKAISIPTWNLLNRGGKRWRPFLMYLSYRSVGGNDDIGKFLPIPELIHNGTLIIDDIEDNSVMRRSDKCIHKLYGNDIAINAGNALYYLPCLILLKDNSLKPRVKSRIYDQIMQEMIKISFGQAMDIYWHKGHKTNISEEQYLQMCAYKTGTLARMSAKLGAILGNATNKQIKALGDFAESLGVAFQIQDDILNLKNDSHGKCFGDDISEGKRTLMVLRIMNVGSNEDKQSLLLILNLRTKDPILIKKAISIIHKYDGIKYAQDKASDIVSDAWKKLDPIIEESEYKSKLRSFVDFVINRKS